MLSYRSLSGWPSWQLCLHSPMRVLILCLLVPVQTCPHKHSILHTQPNANMYLVSFSWFQMFYAVRQPKNHHHNDLRCLQSSFPFLSITPFALKRQFSPPKLILLFQSATVVSQLNAFLQPFIGGTNLWVQDSRNFIDKLSNITLGPNDILVSFDTCPFLQWCQCKRFWAIVKNCFWPMLQNSFTIY